MSRHEILVVPVKLEPHPNAEKLSLVRIGDCQCVVKRADWQGVDRGIHVPPDYLVPRRFVEFLAKPDEEMVRIKPVRLRGELSWGLLLPAGGASLGDNMLDDMGIQRYEPPGPMQVGGENVSGPSTSMAPKYDVEPWEKWASKVFEEGELVTITEKIHGANARYTSVDGEFYAGSRANWKKYNPTNVWWRAVDTHPEIREFCEQNPGVVLYGEIYGPVQSLRYGSPNVVKFATFDVLRGMNWLDSRERIDMMEKFGVPHTPVLHREVPFTLEWIRGMCSGPSLIPGADHIREGIVVEPVVPRNDRKLGRVKLKIVSPEYLTGVKH